MNKMMQSFTIEDIREAIHRWDPNNKTYLLYYHPKDKEVIQEIMTTPVGDNSLPAEIPLIQSGKVLLIDRAKIEDYCFVNYKDIGEKDI